MLTTAATHKHLRGKQCPFISDVFIDTRVFECSCHAWGSHRNWRQSSCCRQDGGEPAVRATSVFGTDISISTQTEYKHLLRWKLLHCPQPVVTTELDVDHALPLVRPATSIANFSLALWMLALLTRWWCQPSVWPVSTPSANFLSNRIIYTESWTLPRRSRWLKTHRAVFASSSCGSRNPKCCG